MDIWNWRYLDFYQGPMTVYLHLYSTNFVSQFLLWSSIRTCLQSSHYEDNHYIFLCCECQSLSMPNRACPKVQSFLVFGLFFYWFLNYTRGRAFRREISNIHTVCLSIHGIFPLLFSLITEFFDQRLFFRQRAQHEKAVKQIGSLTHTGETCKGEEE